MKSNELILQLRGRQVAHLRACFPGLTERALMQMLYCTPKQAVHVLQQSFGCDMEDARAAWNDFVMRYVDGTQGQRSTTSSLSSSFCPHGAKTDLQHC